MRQFIKSIETLNALLQVQQQEPQHQTIKVIKLEIISQVQQQQQLQHTATTQCKALDQLCLGWQECNGGLKELEQSTLTPSESNHEILSPH